MYFKKCLSLRINYKSMRKKLFLTAVIAVSVLFGVQAQRIKGSDTVLPLSQKIAESFMKANPSKTVSVTGGGSGVGISALLEGSTEIAQSSRKIKFSEKQKLQNAKKTAEEVIVAYDALAIIVHPATRTRNLQMEMLKWANQAKTKGMMKQMYQATTKGMPK